MHPVPTNSGGRNIAGSENHGDGKMIHYETKINTLLSLPAHVHEQQENEVKLNDLLT